MLDILCPRSPPARKGIVILKKLQTEISQDTSAVATPAQVRLPTQDADVEDEALGFSRVQGDSNIMMIAEDFNFVENEGWEPIPMGNDLSWFLENDVFFDPAAEDSMDFGGFM